MSDYNSFKAEWNGRRIDWDRVHAYQCVDLILQYAHQVLGVSGIVKGNAIDYWTSPTAALLAKCDRIPTTDCQQGDIVILRTAGRNDFAGDGHIGICDTQDAGNVWLLEQNAVGSGTGTGRDAIGIHRAIPKSRIAGVLRKKVAVSNPIHAYQPIAHIDAVTTKQPTNWWNLNGTTADINSFRPAAVLNIDTPFTIGGYAHHINGHSYAMTPEDFNRAQNGDLSTNNGINVKDLKDRPAPPPPAYKPPEVKIVPRMAEQYELVTDLLCYPSAQNALIDTTPSGELVKGKYFVFGRDRDMINLSDSNMHDKQQWIDPRKNVVTIELPKPVEPEPKPVPMEPVSITLPEPQFPVDDSWKACYPLFDDRLPTKLKSSNTIPVKIKALDGKKPDYLTLPAQSELEIVSWFEKGGVRYYRDAILDDKKRYYALPVEMFPDPYNLPKSSMDTNRDGDVQISEFVDYIGRYGSQVFKSGVAVINKAAKQIDTRKFIDGFKAGTKKQKDKVQ